MKRLRFVLLFVLVLATSAFAQVVDPPPTPIFPDILAMAALTIAATQIVKKFIEKAIGHDLAPIVGTVLACIVAVGVVLYSAIDTGTAITTALISVLIKVIVAAVGGFKTAKAMFVKEEK